MKKAKKVIFSGLLISTLMIPTSAFAASDHYSRNYNSNGSLLEQLFSFFLGTKETDYSSGKNGRDRDNDDLKKGNDKHHDHDKHDDKNKNKSCSQIDSAEIWKLYYGWGKKSEKEWEHCEWGASWDKEKKKDKPEDKDKRRDWDKNKNWQGWF